MKSKSLLALSFVFLMASCADEKSPETVASSFLNNYLDLRLKSAAKLASPEVVEQMRWRVSNLTQAEVELLAQQEEPTDVEVEEVSERGDTCVVVLSAHGTLVADSIDSPGHIGDARYRVTLAKEKGSNWKVTALSSDL